MRDVRVVAAILTRKQSIFAAHRTATEGGLAGWEFPGGKVEPNESEEEALCREIGEELGLQLSTMWLLDTIEYDYPNFHLIMSCFICPLPPEGQPLPREHDEVRWITRDELLDVDWLPPDLMVAHELGMYWDQLFAAEHL